MSLEIEKVPAVAAILRKAEEDIRAVMGIKIILAVDAFEIKLKNKDILQRVVTDYYNATWEDIISHSRPRELSDAMFAYMYIARKVLKNTTTEIGKDCNRDHSTVIAAIKRVTNYYAINDGTSYDINVIEKRFLKKMNL